MVGKPKYKQSELGVIPEDWNVVGLGSKCILITKGTTPTSIGKAFTETGVKFLKAETISESGKTISKKIAYIDDATNRIMQRSQLMTDDLLITIAGVLGRVGLIENKDLPANINQALAIVRLKKNDKADRNFLFYTLQSSIIAKQINDINVQAAQANISLQNVRDFLVALPPTVDEQKAIARALSDTDALIEALEQLIAKKRQVKQGAMQELLRPKEGWELFELGDIADQNQQWSFTGGPFGSNLKSSDYKNDGVRIIQLQNIGDGVFKDDYKIFTSVAKANELMSCNIFPGEIILSKMGYPVARACIIPQNSYRYLMCSDGIRLAVDKKRFDPYFIFTMINSSSFRIKAESASTGSTRKRIGLSELRHLTLSCPAIIKQNLIAETFYDMENEIAALEEKLAKTHLVKQGMMQELLTGRIRLV